MNLGEVKPKGSYGLLLKSEPEYIRDDPHGELLRERVRATHYPEKPSRLNSSFVFEKLEDAIEFRNRRGKDEKIYEVSFTEIPAQLHRVCYTAWSMEHSNLELQAHQFWSAPPIYDNDTELFAEVDILVMSDVTPKA